MAESRTLTYFVADVHLGLKAGDPAAREAAFVEFLRSLDVSRTRALYLLGDIWDFWYEYRDVIPKEGIRVLARLLDLVDKGVDVVFCPGNHDIWTYSFFEQSGIRKCEQPFFEVIGGRTFCLGHGDGIGGAKRSYRLLLWIFRNRVLQKLFSTIHPTLAFRFGTDWSNSNRRSHGGYKFAGKQEYLYKYAAEVLQTRPVDAFVFGHFHDSVDMEVVSDNGNTSRLVVLKDWIDGGAPYAVFDGETLSVH